MGERAWSGACPGRGKEGWGRAGRVKEGHGGWLCAEASWWQDMHAPAAGVQWSCLCLRLHGSSSRLTRHGAFRLMSLTRLACPQGGFEDDDFEDGDGDVAGSGSDDDIDDEDLDELEGGSGGEDDEEDGDEDDDEEDGDLDGEEEAEEEQAEDEEAEEEEEAAAAAAGDAVAQDNKRLRGEISKHK